MRFLLLLPMLTAAMSCSTNSVESPTEPGCTSWTKSKIALSPNSETAAFLGYESEGKRLSTNTHTVLNRDGLWLDLLSFDRAETDWVDSICLVDLVSHRVLRQIRHSKEVMYSFATWSPNGSWLAYVASDGGEFYLWVLSADGTINRKLSSRPINVLVASEIGSSVGAAPFDWSPDSGKLIFVSPVERTLSPISRLSKFIEPSIRDTRTEARQSSATKGKQSIALHALNGNIVEVDVERRGGSATAKLADSIYHLTYWDSQRLIVGIVDSTHGEVHRQMYLVDRNALSQDDWRIGAVKLPINNPKYLFRFQESSAKVGALMTASGNGCKPNSDTGSVRVLCLETEGMPYWLTQTPTHFVVVEPSGHIQTFDKQTGNSQWSGEISYESDDSFIPITYPLRRSSDGGLHSDKQGRIVLVTALTDNAEYRAYWLSIFDPKNGERRILLKDDSNERDIVSIKSITASGDPLVTYATEAGRFEHAVLDLASGLLRDLGSALRVQITYSDFKYSDSAYLRGDKVELIGRMFWPADEALARHEKLPLLIWQYPVHFKTVSEVKDRYERAIASRYSNNKRLDYVGLWLPLRFLEAGFAVFHYPAAPLIGADDASELGTFESQMIMNAEAAVRAAVATGRIDIDRIAVAGHSRGGGDAALLLANTDLFKTGISIAGQMNAMLMTHAKQYDERPFWEEPDVYIRASASAKAHMVDEPILMIHGVEDGSNARSATSESLFNGIRKAGGTARLVLLPFMGHQVETQNERDIVTEESIAWLLQYLSPGEESPKDGAAVP